MSDNQYNETQNLTNAAIELGQKLRQVREKRGLSIGEVAERLKLSARQIEELETGHYENLPELVFVRGFLRTYGRFLELDDVEVVNYLDRIMPQERNNVYAVERDQNQSLNYQKTEIKKSFPKWVVAILILAGIVAGVYAWQAKSNAENQRQTNENSTEKQLNQVTTSNLQASNVVVKPMNEEASNNQTNSTAAITSDIQAESSQTVIDKSASAEVTDDSEAIAPDELVVKVRYRSNLIIKDKDGQFLINRIVPARSEHRFRDGAPYDVRIGYAIGAKANYGGQEIVISQHMVGKKTSSFRAGE